MSRKRFTAEQIIRILWQGEVFLSQGQKVSEVCRGLGITQQTYYRWRKEFGGMKVSQARRLKELQRENTRLKRAVAELTLDRWEGEIDLIRASFPERPIIASIAGGGNPHEWQEIVRRVEPHGINGYEINVSCPNLGGKEKGEDKAEQDTKAMVLAVGWVKEATDLPVIVKLTPNVTDIAALAQAAVEAGADALTMGNSLSGLGGINLENFTPLPTVVDKGIIGGYGGPGLKPVNLRCTANIAQDMPTPIFGCGGIERWQDAAEYMTVGASAVQICTAVMWRGIQIIQKLAKGLENYLERHGGNSPSALTPITCL